MPRALGYDSIASYFEKLTDTQLTQISDMYSVYASWNRKINLISRKDFQNFYHHHVLHSLSLAKVFLPSEKHSILDFGTGGGFPGIPLAIMFPKAQFVLVDSIKKKIRVVEHICRELNIQNVVLRSQRVEELRGIHFDALVARSVASIDKILRWTHHLLKKNAMGWYLLKGENTDLEHLKGINYTSWAVSDFFDEPFFQTKKIIHLPRFIH